MGKSTGCLRIIACGGGSFIEANEAGPVNQTKSSKSKEKRGWSFKKKSSTSRAVTNSLLTETPSFEPKKSVNLSAPESFVSEKDSAPQSDEKSPMPPQLATSFTNSYVAYDASSPETEKDSDDANLRATDGLPVLKTGEYEAILSVHESDVIIIQSAVRGFLVRKELASIIKLQAVVRGHLVRCHAIDSLRCVHAIAKMQVLVRARYARTRKDCVSSKSEREITYTSMTDLIRTSFARQLLESSPKSKLIKIKCDPLNRDSTWIWLERWMSLASPGAVDDLNAEENMVPEIFLDAKDRNFSSSREHSKLCVPAEPNVTNSGELTLTHSNADSHSALLVESQKPETESVDKESESKTEQIEELKTEVKAEEVVELRTEFENNVSVSHEESANLHKTESELVSAPLSASSSDSVIQEVGVEEPTTDKVAVAHSSEFDTNDEAVASSEDDIVINHDEAIKAKPSSIQVDESDCSTELSITSTLDSPHRSELELMKVELEPPHESKFITVADGLEIESGSVTQRESDCANAAPNVSQSEAGEDKELEGDTEISRQVSTGSQVTFSESQGTPSSQASVSKKSRVAKSGSIKKRTILSAARKSPMSISSDKTSSGKQHKNQNSVKRRTSFDSPKVEVSNQEQRRDSSTSSSLPSYMHATESARAKANAASQSPRSSPDIPDSDISLKKRHSLSSLKDKQGSPKLTRASSKAHSGSKSNGTSPLERKWQR